MGNFKDLRVWQDAMELVVDIYQICRTDAFARDYGLRDQLQRSAVSIPSNIAEGDERGTNKESIRFFNIAKGSVAETITQLLIAYRVGYLDEKELHQLEEKAEKIRASLKNLIKARKNTSYR
ncbi:four helix bundle protein [Flavilitoribacter nigricans]|uniref:Four helix bundle protein n=1 Tax=Flavilitoribacter nigricans (strain ATCC 23147 / DSM 23189 / NBRC 102662 / NCIMB 1420 / SS-2) TaxID=1122177 RepID=A0A2D0NGF8_FLAN2|nr:four helix bundle protein [Flavilitoribacter nigricans]PHN07557.1 four helix bundle protein [Flavilitoribacter nigricans DSM 23189 = NBRC 102662]